MVCCSEGYTPCLDNMRKAKLLVDAFSELGSDKK